MGCHAARSVLLVSGLLCALHYPWRTIQSISSSISGSPAGDSVNVIRLSAVLVDARASVRLPDMTLTAGVSLFGDGGPLGEQLLPGFGSPLLGDVTGGDRPPTHYVHTHLPEPAAGSSFLGLQANTRLARTRSGLNVGVRLPQLRQSPSTMSFPSSALFPSVSQPAGATFEAPGDKAELSAASRTPPPAMLQVQDRTRGIGTILAGAGLSTLLGGANQYQMGPFAPATPTAPGMMPGGSTLAAAPALAAPGAAPAMAAAAVPAGAAAPAADGDDHHVAAIAIGVIGGLISLCLVGGCVYTMMKRKKKR